MAEDRDIISNEEHELNYLLKKWGKKINSGNRQILSDALDKFKDDNSIENHNRENFYSFAEQNKITDSLASGDAKKDSNTLTEVTGDFKTRRPVSKKSILWIILLIMLVIIVILLTIFGRNNLKPQEKIETVKSSDQNDEMNRKLTEEASKKAELEKINKISEIIKQNSPIYFVMDRDVLLSGEENKINNLISLLKEFKNINLSVEGHTAGIGFPEKELRLSIERADKIKQLLENGLKENSINFTSKGFGADAEAVPSSDRTKWHLNRRVEIKRVL